MSPAGRIFSNRYEVQREIARGGMAQVFLARDRLLDRTVAIKVLHPEFAREPSFVERFRREAQAAANLKHPNIVSIHDFGQEDGTYFIVMEYVEGRSLRELINGNGRVDATRAAAITAEIAAALEYAHRNGVVHRDIKPGNVLLTEDGVVKVTDFGIARAGTSDALTQTGSVMGTATYFSPEQAQGLEVDGRSDVYSLGIVLYEMLTGAPPFSGESPIAVALSHVRDEPQLPSERNPEIPEDLEHIVMTAMAKQPADRYQTAEDLRLDLIRFRRGRPPVAAPVTALVADLDGAAATVAQPRVGPNTAEITTTPPPKPTTKRLLAGAITVIVLVLAVAGIWWAATQNSDGASAVSVPNVVGLSEREGRAILEDDNLSVRVRDVQRAGADEGEIVEQDPRPDTEVEPGSRVTISVNREAPEITVPRVAGLSTEQAIAKLVEEGFAEPSASDIIFEESEDVPFNVVLRTDPPEGTPLLEGSTVKLIVSQGKAAVTVPNVVGMSEQEAADAINAAQLTPRISEVASDNVDAGFVVSTDPRGGERVPKSSTVTVFVSIGPDVGTIPTIVGRTEADARALLQAAGFNDIRTVTVATTDASRDGIVTSSDPPEGSTVAKSETIVLTVADFDESSTTTVTTAPSTTTTTAPTTTTTAGP